MAVLVWRCHARIMWRGRNDQARRWYACLRPLHQPKSFLHLNLLFCSARLSEASRVQMLTCSDPAGPIENSLAKADASYKCNLYQCRGYQYEDNVDNVNAYSAGDIVPFYVDLVAAHKPGWAVRLSFLEMGTGCPLCTENNHPPVGTDQVNRMSRSSILPRTKPSAIL